MRFHNLTATRLRGVPQRPSTGLQIETLRYEIP